MSKRSVYIICSLILCMFLCQYTSIVSAQGDASNVGIDDLDSFFEGMQDDEEIISSPEYDASEQKSEEIIQEEPKVYYPPPEPVPEFDSETEKYIYYARKYLTEVCLASILVVYMLNFFVGKKVNTKVATMWLAEAIPLLRQNFAHLGFGEESNLSLSQISYTEFEFYATGRDYCHYLFLNMNTKKRQDVITGGLFGLIWPEHDRIVLDIPIDVDLPLEMLICRKYNVKKTQQEMPNINTLITPINVERFKDTSIAVLAETSETVDIVLNNR